MQWLNLVGRLTFIKSILSSPPLNQYKIIQAPFGIQKKIEIIIRNFLWQGGKLETKKFGLVRWNQVTTPYENGGTSI